MSSTAGLSKRIPAGNCTHCVNILIDYQIKHTEEKCPLRASLYCLHCRKHAGHATKDCQAKPPDHVYASSIQGIQRQIARRREAAAAAEREEPDVGAKEILDNEKVLREFVRARIGIPAVKPEENKKRIKEWAKAVGTAVRYIPDEAAVENFAEYDRIYAELNPKTAAEPAQTQ